MPGLLPTVTHALFIPVTFFIAGKGTRDYDYGDVDSGLARGRS